MNKYFITTIAAIIMFGCQQHTGSNTLSETKQSEASSDVAVESQSVIKKQVPYIGDFFQITNMSDFDIEFTQGDYDVVIEAPATIANILRTSFDCGIITFSQLEEAPIPPTTPLSPKASAPSMCRAPTCRLLQCVVRETFAQQAPSIPPRFTLVCFRLPT